MALIVSRRSLHILTYRVVFLELAVLALAAGLPCSSSRVSSPQQYVVPAGSRGRKEEKKAQIPGLDGPTSNYLTSTRARYRTSCLLVPGVGMLTYARCLACKNACEVSHSKPNLFYPSSRYRHATFSLPINPALSVTASAGGRYFVYGQNYPLLKVVTRNNYRILMACKVHVPIAERLVVAHLHTRTSIVFSFD